jgi:hypothetical protein
MMKRLTVNAGEISPEVPVENSPLRCTIRLYRSMGATMLEAVKGRAPRRTAAIAASRVSLTDVGKSVRNHDFGWVSSGLPGGLVQVRPHRRCRAQDAARQDDSVGDFSAQSDSPTADRYTGTSRCRGVYHRSNS